MEQQKLERRKKKALLEGNQEVLASTCIDLAEFYVNNERYEKAIKEYKIVATAFEQLGRIMDYGKTHQNIAETYLTLREYDEALTYQQVHLDIANEQGNKLEQQRAHAQFGHIHLARFLDGNDDTNTNNATLNSAYKAFKKSLTICENLTGISKIEHKDMLARLFANLGIVQEYLGNCENGIELLEKSINICKQHDIFEQWERSCTSLASLYSHQFEYSKAIHYYNLAISVAKRLPCKATLICSSLSAKAEIYIKMANFRGARNELLKAYKFKHPNKVERRIIEHNLKVLAKMCMTENALLKAGVTDFKKRKKLYETMGDGSCELRNFPKAIEYYEKMLEAAIKNGNTEEDLNACYVSLALTYKDNKQYSLAIEYFQKEYSFNKNNTKESVKTLLYIADTMNAAGYSADEVEAIFEQAKRKSSDINDTDLTSRVLKKYITYLNSQGARARTENLEGELRELNCVLSDTESETSEEANMPSIGDNVDIEDITDDSDESDIEKDIEKPRAARTKSKSFQVKRNMKGETQLHTACISGNLELTRRLLNQGHPVNVRDHCGWLPIHEACINGHLEILELLLDNGAAINDRGGANCDGISPIHDAASNGHLEIIELLLKRGASPVAKNNSGETALHILKRWRKTVKLNSSQSSLYDNIVKSMSNALENSGHNKDVLSNERTAALVDYDEPAPQIIKKKSNEFGRTSQNCNISVNKQMIGNLRRNADLDDADNLPSTSSYKRDSNIKSLETSHKGNLWNAADEYKMAIENVKRPYSTSENKKRKSQELIKKTAWISMDDVDDDWLDNDLGINYTKKRKNNPVETLMTTSNIRGPAESCTSSKSNVERKFTKKYSNSSISSFTDESNRLLEVHSDADEDLQQILEEVSKEGNVKHVGKRKNQISLIAAGFNRICTSPPKKQQKHGLGRVNKHKLQMKLTNLNLAVNIEPDSTTPESNEVDESISSNVCTQQRSENHTLSIDIKIEDRLYRVPISSAEIHIKTIKWLAEEAANRYFKKECIKPVLELETKNGAILGEDDLVNILFPHGSLRGEEVQTKIIKWNLPQLADRYKEVCTNMNNVADPLILKIIQESTTTIDLSDKNLRCEILHPFCRAVNRQSDIHHINLSGNLMTNESILLLCSSLPSLDNLAILNLSLNCLDAQSLKYISDVFTDSPKPILENLISLDLSYNSLTNDCLKYLAIITRNLQLRTLNLSAVDFTVGCFDHFYNKNIELYLEYVENFNISNNDLNVIEITQFISWLTPSAVVSLDLSNNAVNEQGLLRSVIHYLTSSAECTLKLKNMNFSRCFVTDSEVFDLLGILRGVADVQYLNLSYNDDLTTLTLRRLIQHYPPLERLELHGCENIFKFFNECCINKTWFLVDTEGISVKKIKHLTLSVDYKANRKECDILIDAWKEEYGENCKVIIDQMNFLEISVA